jgi:hypothetical protein
MCIVASTLLSQRAAAYVRCLDDVQPQVNGRAGALRFGSCLDELDAAVARGDADLEGDRVSEGIRGRAGHSVSTPCERDTSAHRGREQGALRLYVGHPARTRVAGAVARAS